MGDIAGRRKRFSVRARRLKTEAKIFAPSVTGSFIGKPKVPFFLLD